MSIKSKELPGHRNDIIPTERITYIYALINPFTCRVFYVGSTFNPLSRRLYHHISCAMNNIGSNAKRNNEILSIISKGRRPLIQELEVCTGYVAPTIAERFWIYQYGFVLGNKITNGKLHGDFLLTRKLVPRWSASKRLLLSRNP